MQLLCFIKHSMSLKYLLPRNFLRSKCRCKSAYSHLYKQGQYADKNIREYFYFVDHQGQLFLDDVKVKNFITCFKDKAFLEFFFKRVRKNSTGSYENGFPYLSLCGRERNYIRCDDTPIVYTHLVDVMEEGNPTQYLSCCGAGDKLLVPFKPESLCMLPDSGRVYHEAKERFGGIGLVKSSLAIELSGGFCFDNEDETSTRSQGVLLPTRFFWKGNYHKLTNGLVKKLADRD